MAGAAVASILSECHISASQEEVLANLRGGWERNLHYSLDETPSQTFGGFQSPKSPYDGEEDGEGSSEASESVDGEGNLGFMQEPVDWISPPSSPHANVVGAEGCGDGMAKEDSVAAEGSGDGMAKEDSVAAEGSGDGMAKEDSVAAEGSGDGVAKEDSSAESDLSQSPSEDWHGQMEGPDPQPNLGVGAEFLTQPNLGINAEFLTQPALGVMDFQFTSSEDVDDQILRRENIPEPEFVPLRRRSLPLLSPIAENSVIGIPVLLSCIQPYTQAFESQLPESHNHTQEPVEQMEAIEERNEIHHPPVLDKDRPGTEEPQPTQQGRGGGELVRDASTLDNDEFEMLGEQSSEGRGGDELLPTGSRMCVDDTRHLRSTDHKQQLEHDRSSDVPLVEIHNDAGVSEKAQPVVECVTERIPANADQVQRGNGDTSSPSKAALKRVSGADELHGQQKRLRVQVSPARARSDPKTVMDVVRSSLSSPPVDDECSILSLMMRAGLSFPPFVNDKRSV